MVTPQNKLGIAQVKRKKIVNGASTMIFIVFGLPKIRYAHSLVDVRMACGEKIATKIKKIYAVDTESTIKSIIAIVMTNMPVKNVKKNAIHPVKTMENAHLM